jgi:N-formylmaleamate deformylase
MQNSTKRILFILYIIWIACLSGRAQSYQSFSVTVEGKGKAVLLIPGYSCSGEVWRETVAILKKNYECHVFTLAGYAGVPAIDTPVLKTVHDDIIRYTIVNNLNHPILIGHSLGAFMSLWLSATHPGLFGKIICVDGVPFISAMADSTMTAEKIKANPYYNPSTVAANFVALPDSGYIDNMTRSMQSQVSDTARARQIAGWSYRSDRKTLGYTIVEMSSTDLRRIIGHIQQPVLVLGSIYMGSAETSRRILEQQYRQLAGKTIHIASSKHFIMYDQPQWFYEEITAFMAG